MHLPFGRIPLLFHLGKNTFVLVIDAVRARRQFPVAFDLLLSAHVTSLWTTNSWSAPLRFSIIVLFFCSPARFSSSSPHSSLQAANGLRTWARRPGRAVGGEWGCHARYIRQIFGGVDSSTAGPPWAFGSPDAYDPSWQRYRHEFDKCATGRNRYTRMWDGKSC